MIMVFCVVSAIEPEAEPPAGVVLQAANNRPTRPKTRTVSIAALFFDIFDTSGTFIINILYLSAAGFAKKKNGSVLCIGVRRDPISQPRF
jgi:hypothetical protein